MGSQRCDITPFSQIKKFCGMLALWHRVLFQWMAAKYKEKRMQICKKRLPFKNSIFLTPRVGDKLQKKPLGSRRRSAENCA